MEQKKFNYQKIIIFFMLFVFVIAIVIGTIDNSKYEPIIFGDSSFLLPKRITEGMNRSDGEDYVYIQNDDYLVLGIGPDCEDVDEDILERFNISPEDIDNANSIRTGMELMKLIRDTDGVIVDTGRADKPSFDCFFVHFRSDGWEEVILAYRADDKNLIEIIIAPENDISDKEIIKMNGCLRFD